MSEENELTMQEKLLALGIEVKDIALNAKKLLQACAKQEEVVQQVIISHQKETEKIQKSITDLVSDIPNLLQDGACQAVVNSFAKNISRIEKEAEKSEGILKKVNDKFSKGIDKVDDYLDTFYARLNRQNLFHYIGIFLSAAIIFYGIFYYGKHTEKEILIAKQDFLNIKNEKAKLGEFGFNAFQDLKGDVWIILPPHARLETSGDLTHFSGGREGWKITK